MFSTSDLTRLAAVETPLAVSIFLPTHVAGADVRQDPIRLKNLVGRAREELLEAGMPAGEADAVLAPALALLDDEFFWQHQDIGLALFLDHDGLRSFQVPLELEEQVTVGPGFHTKALLPLLAADGAFRVLALAARKVTLYNGSRFALVEDGAAELPQGIQEDAAESDYQNPVQASPAARGAGSTAAIGNAQVYGDSPPEWRKTQLVEFAHKVAAAMDTVTSHRKLPVVLVADAELGGHFRKASGLGALLDAIETHPESLDRGRLHDVAYDAVRPRLDTTRRDAVERFAALKGQHDPKVAWGLEHLVKSAHRGQVETLMLRMEPTVWGCFDAEAGTVTISETRDSACQDLVERAAAMTLEHGGTVHVLDPEDLPEMEFAAAILRF